MKTNQFRFPIMSVFFLLFFCTNYLTANVVWDGASKPSSVKASSDGGSLVIDGSFGDVVLDTGPTTIWADTSDIIVTLHDNPTVRAHKREESQLILRSCPGKKIIFLVEHDDLTFKGARNKTQTPLLLFVVPGSKVDFVINGKHNVSFTSDKRSGGTMAFVALSDECSTKMSFIRNPFSCDCEENVGINVGKRSLVSFASQGCERSGVISFDPTNKIGSEGRMTLSIATTGGFVVRPSDIHDDIVKPKKCMYIPTLADIDTKVLGGGHGKVEIINTGDEAQASLQVINKNDRLFDLLADPFYTLDAREDIIDYNGLFSGVQYGFVLGANGILDVNDNAFLDYVGLANNVCPLSRCLTNTAADQCCPIDCCITNTAFQEIHCFEGFEPESITKKRNPSAFFVDGSVDPCSAPAQIYLGKCSAIFFRSGVDNNGVVKYPDAPYQFTINPARQTPGAGEIVFDVEGALKVHGSNDECRLLSKLEILSREVVSTGGSLFYNDDKVIFPKRTCNVVDCCFFRQYNSASFLINNRVDLFDTVLVHTDQNHKVVRNNDVISEPTYVGGEIAFLTERCVARPKIVFYNSDLFVHTDIAFTGLDLLVPNFAIPDQETLRKPSSVCNSECDDLFCELACDFCDDCDAAEAFPLRCKDNISEFRFFYNGNKLDNGVGRQMILGTCVGSYACDDYRVISADAHLDVIPDACCDASGAQVKQLLILNTDANTKAIICELDDEDITDEFSLQTIFLGNASNISIGEQIDNQANCF